MVARWTGATAMVLGGLLSLNSISCSEDAVFMVCIAIVAQLVLRIARWTLLIRAKGRQTRTRSHSLRDVFFYELDYWFSTDPAAKTSSLLWGTVFFGFAGAAALLAVHGSTLYPHEALWKTFNWLAEPSAMFSEPRELRVASLCLTVLGMILSALVVGVVGERIAGHLDTLRSGTTPVKATGHTLILGWSSKIVPLIRELAISHISCDSLQTLCIMSHLSKNEMEKELLPNLPEKLLANTLLILRRGTPALDVDLKRVGLSNAKSVIVLDGPVLMVDGTLRSEQAVCVALKVKSALAKASQVATDVVIEVNDSSCKECIEMIRLPNCTAMLSTIFESQVLCNFVISPQLHEVLRELTSFAGAEIYIVERPETFGKSFREVHMSCIEATVVGVQRQWKSGQFFLNPPDTMEVQKGDCIVVIASDAHHISFNFEANYHRSQAALIPGYKKFGAAGNYAFIGWRAGIVTMIRQMDDMVAPGSTLTCIADVPVREQIERLRREGLTLDTLKNLEIVNVEGNISHVDTLRALTHRPHYFSVTVFSHDTDNSDTLVIPTLLLLTQQIFLSANSNTVCNNIICEVKESRHKRLIQSIDSRIIAICADEIASSALAQVSQQPVIQPIYEEIFSTVGCQFYLHVATKFVTDKGEYTWHDIMLQTRARRAVAVGYIISGDEKVILNPKWRNHRRKWSQKDMLIVLAN